jgi:hypothetical protein
MFEVKLENIKEIGGKVNAKNGVTEICGQIAG